MNINAAKLQKDLKRFCNHYHGCTGCPLNELVSDCYNTIDHLTEVILVVQKWAKEHPETYLSDMKEKFPKLVTDDSFYNDCCVEDFYGTDFKCRGDCRDCWNREME